MTDWDEIVGYIQQAMNAVDEAHSASEDLKQNADHATFEVFRNRMKELEEHLQRLKAVLDNEEAFAIDELMDALSRVYTSHAADYRKTPRMNS